MLLGVSRERFDEGSSRAMNKSSEACKSRPPPGLLQSFLTICGIQFRRPKIHPYLSLDCLFLINHCEDPRQRGEQRLAAWPNTVPFTGREPGDLIEVGNSDITTLFLPRRTGRTSTYFLTGVAKESQGSL